MRLELKERVVVRKEQVLLSVERGSVGGEVGSLASIDVEPDVVWYLAAGGLDWRITVISELN